MTGPYELWALFGRPAQQMWDGLLDQGYRIAAVGGSDDHRAGIDLSSTQSPIGSPTTVVYAESLSEEAILEGIRAGRVVVKLRGPDDPMAEIVAEGPGGERAMMGGTIAAGRVTLEARVTGGDGTRLLLFKNGASVDHVDVVGDDFAHRFEQETSPEGDRYRLHVVDGSDATITNHVYVDFAELPDGGDDGGGCGCRAGSSGAGGALLAVLGLVALRRRRESTAG